MDLVILSVSILICAALLFFFIGITKTEKIQLDKLKFQGDWLKIENSIKKDEPATWHLALKNSKDKFSSPNSIWHAHKLRNVIAHENDAEINFDQTRRAMNSFKQALKDLGAI